MAAIGSLGASVITLVQIIITAEFGARKSPRWNPFFKIKQRERLRFSSFLSKNLKRINFNQPRFFAEIHVSKAILKLSRCSKEIKNKEAINLEEESIESQGRFGFLIIDRSGDFWIIWLDKSFIWKMALFDFTVFFA